MASRWRTSTDEHFKALFKCISQGKIAKEAIPQVLAELAKSPAESIDVAIGKLSLGNVGEDEVRNIIAEIVKSKSDFIKEKGESAQSGLMGLAMSKLRGKGGRQADQQGPSAKKWKKSCINRGTPPILFLLRLENILHAFNPEKVLGPPERDGRQNRDHHDGQYGCHVAFIEHRERR